MIETHGACMSNAHYARMGRPECERIHMASLEILERTGLDVHDPEARQLLVQAGARADGVRTRLPAPLVERALSAGAGRRWRTSSTPSVSRTPCQKSTS